MHALLLTASFMSMVLTPCIVSLLSQTPEDELEA